MLQASVLDRQTNSPLWWQDWSDKPCALIASGSSVQKQDLPLLRGKLRVAAIKENILLCPWADMVYGCDVHWWRHRRGLPDYKGLRIAYDPNAGFNGINIIKIPDKNCDYLLFGEPGVLGSGGNSGFQLLNLVCQLGAKKILLIGFDMRGDHWYGRNNWDYANNPSESNFKRWVKAFNACGSQLSNRGIEVVNASSRSAITAFKKMTIMEAVEQWAVEG